MILAYILTSLGGFLTLTGLLLRYLEVDPIYPNPEKTERTRNVLCLMLQVGIGCLIGGFLVYLIEKITGM